MDKGETTGKDHMKLFGIEDICGNAYSFIDGYWCDDNLKLCTITENFSTNGANYIARDSIPAQGLWRYVTKVVGNIHSGFRGIENIGSETTYYGDCHTVVKSRGVKFGGCYENASAAGMFCIDSNAASTYTDSGSRLMYLSNHNKYWNTIPYP